MAERRASPVYARSAEVIGTKVADHTILLHTINWTYLDFDPIGEKIWAQLESPRSLDELIAALIECYAVSEADCRRDTMIFLADMMEKGFLVTRSSD